jgi:hypothetical protein
MAGKIKGSKTRSQQAPKPSGLRWNRGPPRAAAQAHERRSAGLKLQSPAKRPPRAPQSDVRAWVVTVDMGLGHQRATYPLMEYAEGGIIAVGSSQSSDPAEKKQLDRLRGMYEFLSRVRSVPVVGKPLFGILDALQSIPSFYPIRDLSNPSFQVKLISSFIQRGLCKGLIEKLEEQPLPLITSYFAPAIAADLADYGRIYCIICDAEVSRAWVPENPAKSRIHYLAPCGRAIQRLNQYGVPDERVFLTGFPFPKSVLGNKDLDVLREDQGQRLYYLDPKEVFWPLHGQSVAHFLGRNACRFKRKRRLTITYAVGGAGAQREIGWQIARSLREKLKSGEVVLNLIAGVRTEIQEYYLNVKNELLPGCDNLRVLYSPSKDQYFDQFAQTMRHTDILWTKPSELSFYAGLGIPIIMSPHIGAQELYNQKWLLEIQAAFPQEDPEYTAEWLYDLLNAGRLAECSWDGFLKARKYGTYKIEEILRTGTMIREGSPLKR